MRSRAILIDVLNAGLNPNKQHKHLSKDGHIIDPSKSTVVKEKAVDVVQDDVIVKQDVVKNPDQSDVSAVETVPTKTQEAVKTVDEKSKNKSQKKKSE